MDNRHIAFIGAGNMSRSIISGLVKSGYDASAISAINPSQPKLDALQAEFGINIGNDNIEACRQADVIVLAVKPQLMAEVCGPIASLDLSNKLIISIAAGVSCNSLTEYLQQPIALVRTMPNTPSMLGLGLTGLYAPDNVTSSDRAFAGKLMAAVGEIVWSQQESGINQVIACAGSSPAYFFLFMEAMEQAAAGLGVAPDDARLMIQQAAVGAAQMVKQNPQLSLAELRAQVTSKGGTTAEAINTFEQHNLRSTVDAAMNAAVNRAEQMANQF
ncbi:pyrroline-5-carboxylate reductase [Ferrimonas lipolytica]|uniref:Pyrroline-5-carboxylate reductase n=1 Tax=Ferrimonas lipolytica TaxID=2724191 RepID=A0A6H1UBI2_9GAMM|nr:pyrroline-5-carboxylate reductase [Ferrimonas lipolytica]QIZ75723.1 pyrroline-5-carboxylate reductase [Ferrimonas lipolytica]